MDCVFNYKHMEEINKQEDNNINQQINSMNSTIITYKDQASTLELEASSLESHAATLEESIPFMGHNETRGSKNNEYEVWVAHTTEQDQARKDVTRMCGEASDKKLQSSALTCAAEKLVVEVTIKNSIRLVSISKTIKLK